jgi:hypothetical protein
MMRMIADIVLLSVIAPAVFAANNTKSDIATKPDVLFVLGGQSNMAGNGYTADLPDTRPYGKYRLSPANVSIWHNNRKVWTRIRPGRQFGPDIGLAHALSKAMPGKHIGLGPGQAQFRGSDAEPPWIGARIACT